MKGWDRYLWLGVCSHNVWNWKINWTLNYLKVLLELIKSLLPSQIGHLCQTENSRFFPDYREETNCHFLNNMVAGLGKPQSVQWEESFLCSVNHEGTQHLAPYAGCQVTKWEEPCRPGPPSSSCKRTPRLSGRGSVHFPFWVFLYHRTFQALSYNILCESR